VQLLKNVIATATIVLIAMLIDVGLLHRQATQGKLPFRIKLMPDIGGQF
jgi:hypothetical protein